MNKLAEPPGTLKKKCFAHHHLTPEQYGLWTHAREVSHDSGVFYLSLRAVANHFGGTGKNTVLRIAEHLKKTGWFQVLREGSRAECCAIRALSHEEWATVNPGHCVCSKQDTTGEGCPESRTPSVPEAGQGVPEQGHGCPGTRTEFDIESDSKTENRKEKANSPLFASPKPSAKAKPTDPEQFFVWLAEHVDGLSLTSRERKLVTAVVQKYPMTVLTQAVDRALDGLEPRNSYDRCGDKLAANLESQCRAVEKRVADQMRQTAIRDKHIARNRAEADARMKALEAEQAAEAELTEEFLPQD